MSRGLEVRQQQLELQLLGESEKLKRAELEVSLIQSEADRLQADKLSISVFYYVLFQVELKYC